MQVKLLYFASLRDAAGIAEETLQTESTDLRDLYKDCRSRYGFALPTERLRVAVDGSFAHWDDKLSDGSEIAFIPPVSGG